MIYLHNQRKEQVRECENRAEAEDQKKKLIELGMSPDNLAITTEDPRKDTETKADGGSQDVEVVADDTPTEEAKPTQADSDALEQRSVTDDPFEWLPGHYVDHIEGEPAINRQGYAVLSQFYDINVTSDVVVGPEETDFEYCRCEATAYDSDGNEYRAHGSAHVDRGDDKHLLLEMADTRATKRVLAVATGVGAVAVEELKNEL